MESYKLVGIINMFDVYPDFVFPIFASPNGGYFFSDTPEKSVTITDFVRVKDSMTHLIQKITDFKVSKVQNNLVHIGSPSIVIFQLDATSLQVGTVRELRNFLLKYCTRNDILRSEVNDFLDEYQDI